MLPQGRRHCPRSVTGGSPDLSSFPTSVKRAHHLGDSLLACKHLPLTQVPLGFARTSVSELVNPQKIQGLGPATPGSAGSHVVGKMCVFHDWEGASLLSPPNKEEVQGSAGPRGFRGLCSAPVTAPRSLNTSW